MIKQFMKSLLEPDDRLIRLEQLADVYGVEYSSFLNFLTSKGWLKVCNNPSYLTTDDISFLIYQISEIKGEWANEKLVNSLFKSDEFSYLYFRCSNGDNSLSARIDNRIKDKIALALEIESIKTESQIAKEDISLLMQDNESLRYELSETKAILARTLIKLNEVSEQVQAMKRNARNLLQSFLD